MEVKRFQLDNVQFLDVYIFMKHSIKKRIILLEKFLDLLKKPKAPFPQYINELGFYDLQLVKMGFIVERFALRIIPDWYTQPSVVRQSKRFALDYCTASITTRRVAAGIGIAHSHSASRQTAQFLRQLIVRSCRGC